MKKIILSAVILLAFGVIGCNSNGSDPKGVLMSFIDALSKKDIEGAKKFATKDSEAMLGMMQMMMSMAPKDTKEDIYDKSSMEIGDAKITGDIATVPVKNKKSGETTNYTLKKESGAWKVAFTKDGMPGGDKMKNMQNNGMDKMNEGLDSASKMLQDMKNDKETDDTTH